jgi:hypothetical protein
VVTTIPERTVLANLTGINVSADGTYRKAHVMPLPQPGFWADVGQFDFFDECIPPKACPGLGKPCLTGYTGKKCGFCAKRYGARLGWQRGGGLNGPGSG